MPTPIPRPITPEPVIPKPTGNPIVDLERARILAGRSPWTTAERSIGALAAMTNGPVAPEADSSIFENTINDLRAITSAIPKLPMILAREASELRDFDWSNVDLSNPANIATVPGVRMLPGTFIAGQFAEGGQGTSGLLSHPLLTVLDVSPFARKAASLTRTARDVAALREAGAVRTWESPTTGEPLTRVVLPEHRPIRDLIRYWRPGGIRVQEMRDPVTRAMITEATDITGRPFQEVIDKSRFQVDPLSPQAGAVFKYPFEAAPNRIGRLLDAAKERVATTTVGRLTARVGSQNARMAAQLANEALTRHYYDPITKREDVGAVIPEALELSNLLDEAGQRELFRKVTRAHDEAELLSSLSDEERAVYDRWRALSGKVTQTLIDEGQLAEVPFEHGAELYDIKTAKKIYTLRDTAARANDLAGRLRLIDEPEGITPQLLAEDMRSLLETSVAPHSQGRFTKARFTARELRQAVKANLAIAHKLGFDVTAPWKIINRSKNWITELTDFFEARRWRYEELGHVTPNATALSAIENVSAQKALDLLRRGRLPDSEVTREWFKMERKVQRFAEKLAPIQETAQQVSKRLVTFEQRAFPARFKNLIYDRALDAWRAHQEVLADEWVAEQADKGRRVSRRQAPAFIQMRMDLPHLQAHRLSMANPNSVKSFLKFLRQARNAWQTFALNNNPVWVHQVSDFAARRMSHPQVLGFETSVTQNRARSLVETFPAVESLPISLYHQAHEVLLNRATVDFLDRIAETMGRNGRDLQRQYLREARVMAEKKNIDVNEALKRLINRDWMVLDARSFFRGTKPEPLIAFASNQILIPREVGENILSFTQELGAFSKVMAKPTAVFRTAVMPLSPRWHFNNILSGLVLTAVDNPRAFLQMREAWRKVRSGKHTEIEGLSVGRPELKVAAMWGGDINPLKLPTEAKLAAAHQWLAGTSVGRVVGDALQALGPRGISWVRAIRDKGGQFIRWSYDFNEMFDDFFRVSTYLEGERAALKRGATRDVAREAGVEAARRIMQNWDRLTPLERNAIRNVMPFYSWFAHILRFVRKYPARHPWVTAFAARMAEVEWNDHLSGVPIPFKELLFLGDPNGPGNIPAIQVRSFNPFADTANWAALLGFIAGMDGGEPVALTTQVNPVLGSILEALGIDPMSGPELYPELEYDPTSGGIRAHIPNVPLLVASNIMPQFRTIADLVGWNNEFRRLAMENPAAAQRRLIASLGLPVITRPVNVDQEQAKAEIRRWQQFLKDRSDAIRRGKVEDLERWPVARFAAERLRQIERPQPDIAGIIAGAPAAVFIGRATTPQ